MATNTVLDSVKTPTKAGVLGIIAGEGKLPMLLARNAKSRGWRVIALGISQMACERIEPYADKVYEIAPGQVGRNVRLLKENSADSLVFIGKVPKLTLLKNMYKFDWEAIKELSRLPDFNDDTVQLAVGDFAERHGVVVLTQSEFLRELFPEVGVMTKRVPNAAEYADIEFGMRVAKSIASLDIGQTVVVKDQMIMAIEAIEGTDEAIKRAVALAKGPVVVCKVAKPNQDQRFDIPTVGLRTLNSMLNDKGGGVLAVGAHETMVVEREEMTEFCDQHGMTMVAV